MAETGTPASPADHAGGPAAAPERPASRRRRPSRAGLLLGAAACWILLLLLEKAVDGRVWIGELVGAVPPFLFAVVPLALVALAPLARPRRAVVAGLAALGLTLGLDQAGLNVAALWAPDRVPPGALHVVAWNTNSWDQLLGAQDRFYALLVAQHADVYLLQEYQHVTPDRKRALPVDDLARLRRAFPGYAIAVKGELVTVSRFPILAEPAVGPERSVAAGADWDTRYRADKVLRTDLLVGGGVVSVYNVHLPVWNQMADGLLSSAFFDGMHEGYRQRREQIDGLARDVRGNGHPVVLAGDFDTSAAMADLDALRGLVADAAGADPDLYPTSWEEGGWKPFWRTDWAFTGHGVQARRYRFLAPRQLSDHALQDLWVSLPAAPAATAAQGRR